MENEKKTIDSLSLNIEIALKENKSWPSLPFELLALRVLLACRSLPVPCENFLHYYAQNAIKKSSGCFSEKEAKLLLFCAPLHLGRFILEKVIQNQKDEKDLSTYSPQIFATLTLVLHESIELLRENGHFFRTAHYLNANNMIPIVLEKFRMHCGEPQKDYFKTIQPINTIFAMLSGTSIIRKSETEKELIEKQLVMVEEYYLPLLNNMTKSTKLCQLVPFVEWSIYSYTTKNIESLKTHGKILEMTFPYYQRAGIELALPFAKFLNDAKYIDLMKRQALREKKIAFLLVGNAKTGHIQQFLQLVNSTKGADKKKYFLFLFDIENQEIIKDVAKNSAFEVPVYLDEEIVTTWCKVPFSLLLLALKYNISHLVFVSVSTNLGITSGLFAEFYKLTKIKIKLSYYSMKNYLGFTDNNILKMKSRSVQSKLIEGNWHDLQCYYFPKLVDKEKWEKAQVIKQKLMQKTQTSIVVGAIARTERFNENYVTTILNIMRENKNLLYVYGSREEISLFSQKADDESVLNRIEYLGFVDMFVYARVIDLIIDTFPFGSGVVGIQMLANENAIISVQSFELDVSSWLGYAKPFLQSNLEKNNNLYNFHVNPICKDEMDLQKSVLSVVKNKDTLARYKKSLALLYKDIEGECDDAQSLNEIIGVIQKQ